MLGINVFLYFPCHGKAESAGLFGLSTCYDIHVSGRHQASGRNHYVYMSGMIATCHLMPPDLALRQWWPLEQFELHLDGMTLERTDNSCAA